MNKQEALEALKENSWEFETNYFKYELVIDLKDAQEIISQIDPETGEILDGGSYGNQRNRILWRGR